MTCRKVKEKMKEMIEVYYFFLSNCELVTCPVFYKLFHDPSYLQTSIKYSAYNIQIFYSDLTFYFKQNKNVLKLTQALNYI